MRLRLLALLALSASTITAIPVQAAETRVVTGVSAYYRVDLGYMVGWTIPKDTSKITGYTVTSIPGNITCIARWDTANKCTFSNQQLGYKTAYTFTVTINTATENGPASAPSNQIKAASIPTAPQIPMAKILSDTSMAIAWVPDPNDGGAPLYGYRVLVWESRSNGDPGAVAYDAIALKPNATVTNLKPSTLYVINVASCNAYGCNSADKWTYISTTGAKGTSTIKPPVVISGGNASTTCWDRTMDGGNASSTGTTITKSNYTCTAPFVDPATYPKIDPTATVLNPVPLATKFDQSISLSWGSYQYSMKAWAATGGVTWFAYLYASSKSPTLGFTIPPVLNSSTPTLCKVDGAWIKFLAPGECIITASVGGDNVWLPSRVATGKITIIP